MICSPLKVDCVLILLKIVTIKVRGYSELWAWEGHSGCLIRKQVIAQLRYIIYISVNCKGTYAPILCSILIEILLWYSMDKMKQNPLLNMHKKNHGCRHLDENCFKKHSLSFYTISFQNEVSTDHVTVLLAY